MSDSNRGYVLVAAIAALFFVGITGAKELRCQRDYYAQGSYQIEYNGQGQQPPRFDRGWLPCIVETAIAAPKAQGASEQQQRDLIAQESMAVWTFWMVVFAAITAGITAVGTIFIAMQVKLTRKAVEDTSEATDAMREANALARRSGELQLRPYLTMVDDGTEIVRKPNWDKPDGSDSPIAYAIRVAIKNSGVTPARNVKKRLGVLFCPSNIDPDEVAYAEVPTPSMDIAPQDCSKSWMTYFFDAERERQFLNGEMTIHVIANIQYDGIEREGDGHLLQFRLFCDKRVFEDKLMSATAKQFIST